MPRSSRRPRRRRGLRHRPRRHRPARHRAGARRGAAGRAAGRSRASRWSPARSWRARMPRALAPGAERAEGEVEAARAALAEAEDAARRAERSSRERLAPRGRAGCAPGSGPASWRRSSRPARVGAGAGPRAGRAGRSCGRRWAAWSARCAHRAGDALREGDDVLTDRRPLDRPTCASRWTSATSAASSPGQEVRLVFDAYPDRVLRGKVWRIVPTVDRLTKSADVLVELPGRAARRCSSTSPPPSTSSPGSSRTPWWCRATRSTGAATQRAGPARRRRLARRARGRDGRGVRRDASARCSTGLPRASGSSPRCRPGRGRSPRPARGVRVAPT